MSNILTCEAQNLWETLRWLCYILFIFMQKSIANCSSNTAEAQLAVTALTLHNTRPLKAELSVKEEMASVKFNIQN